MLPRFPRLRIRGKLIGTLVLAVVLPLALSVAAVVLAVHQTSEALAGELLFWLVVTGVAIVALCFLGGLLIAEREIIAPVLMLAKAARELERGRFHYRLDPPGVPGSLFRRDELGRLAEQFNRMADRLERDVAELEWANRLKQQFIDVASHELRTPITYILGVVELAQRQGEMTPVLVKIAAKAQRLNRIVENMFKLLQSGSYEPALTLGPVDLHQVVLLAASDVDPFVRQRQQTLALDVPAEELTIEADAEKLRDILNNLLTNAIRFSPDGSTIRLTAADRGDRVEVTVCDQGPGIPAEHLARIFEPFYTGVEGLSVHTSGEFQYMTRGIGLGLSVVKRFVEMHGGTVAIDSSGAGAVVRVTLPKHPPPARETAAIRGK